MPTPKATFATLGRTYPEGVEVSDDDPAVLLLPDLFDGVKPKKAVKATSKKDAD